MAISDFTLAELNSGIVRYVHNGSETVSDSFDFDVDDGTTTLATDSFNITINPVNDPLSLDINTGTSLSQGQEVGIGGREVPAQFGNQIGNYGEGTHASFNGLINGNNNTQMRIIITTNSSNAGGTPGEVIFETGGSGRGIALVLDNNNHLAWYSGPATTTPRMLSPTSLAHNTQYAIVIEVDVDTDEIRMHYEAAGDFNWFAFGRVAEASLGWTDTNLSGGDGTGIGNLSGSIGGYNGARANNDFQGIINSNLNITRFPSGGPTIINDQLVASDVDTASSSLVYTVSTDVQYGTL